jgi:hypothetical protein
MHVSTEQFIFVSAKVCVNVLILIVDQDGCIQFLVTRLFARRIPHGMSLAHIATSSISSYDVPPLQVAVAQSLTSLRTLTQMIDCINNGRRVVPAPSQKFVSGGAAEQAVQNLFRSRLRRTHVGENEGCG